jgi:glycerophosphoryl diester phosphodiesterase
LPTPLIPILSNNNEELCNASSFPQLLKGILQEILLKPLNWEKICEICVADVQAAGSEQCQVVPIGLNNAKNSLVNALKQKGEFDVVLDDRSSNGPAISQGASTTVRFNADIEHLLFTLGARLCLL